MDARPHRRPPAALDFALALQGSRDSLGLAVTAIDVPGIGTDAASAYVDEAGESTLARGAAALAAGAELLADPPAAAWVPGE